MYKIAEVAEELEVHRSTVYGYLSKHEEQLSGHIGEVEGAKAIDQHALNFLKEAYCNSSTVKQQSQQQDNNTDDLLAEKERIRELRERVADLQRHNDILQQQLQEKDRQIERLQMNNFASQMKEQEQFPGESKSVIDRVKNWFKGEN